MKRLVLPLFVVLFCIAPPALAQSDELLPNAKTVPDFTAPRVVDPPVDKLVEPPAAKEEEEENLTMGRGGDYVTGPYYDMLVRQAIKERPKRFEFTTLRSYYAQIAAYDPTGEETLKRLIKVAYDVENEPDPEKRKKAFDEYGRLIAAHLGNIDVVSQALVLSRENNIFGDPKFFEYMQAGLLRSIVQSGDGRSVMKAYDVVTMGEETMLMKALHVRVLKTESAHQGRVYYNMHQVQGRDSVQPYWIFVDVTVPMKYLEKLKEERVKKLGIGRQ